MFLIVDAALAFTPDEVVQRVEATRSHRAASLMASEMPTIPEEMFRRAAAGEVATALQDVEGQRARKAYGVGVIPMGIGPLWAAVNDDVSKPLHNRLDYAEVLQGGLCGADRVVFMHLPVTLLTDRYWVMNARKNTAVQKASNGAVREMVWATRDPEVPKDSRAYDYTVSSMPIAFSKGGWWMTALDAENTLVEYWTWTDPGGNVPAGLASSFAAGGIEDTFAATAALAKAGPRCPVE